MKLTKFIKEFENKVGSRNISVHFNNDEKFHLRFITIAKDKELVTLMSSDDEYEMKSARFIEIMEYELARDAKIGSYEVILDNGCKCMFIDSNPFKGNDDIIVLKTEYDMVDMQRYLSNLFINCMEFKTIKPLDLCKDLLERGIDVEMVKNYAGWEYASFMSGTLEAAKTLHDVPDDVESDGANIDEIPEWVIKTGMEAAKRAAYNIAKTSGTDKLSATMSFPAPVTVNLPCAAGTTIWVIENNNVVEGVIDYFKVTPDADDYCAHYSKTDSEGTRPVFVSDFGRLAFFAKEDAEAALTGLGRKKRIKAVTDDLSFSLSRILHDSELSDEEKKTVTDAISELIKKVADL